VPLAGGERDKGDARLLADEAGQSRRGQSALEAERGDVGVEDAILSEIVGRPDGANRLAPRLFIE